ncbi:MULTISPECIES: hypothetical protein [unclassified Sphingopyxis]|uniref:hypothetical protein n=1 Tax=unclassified Sphingopyxis TaxID=2614943 RepID=UPI00073073B4|nr:MULTISPECIES: hypothetical protein [unclassified Sphingopyxis]KTE23191.1 hypothetical protein ATE61_18120 [Sphingopyxis sp. H057]KTE49429.1 hypothetical protein ATE64_19675 [Sphingopyxis sp. H073]KTE50132.1 hypothetical protein ATE69_18915 [Sphingopyxis sp. H071]KTE58464.1 hypothetical protein ATE66_14825 [Sphingopyxis sp. H107]KTE63163.1 hypothetical protein ATE65_15950 [Sphingopyxis sp. H100]
MSGALPEWIQRSPRYFYAAAVLMFFAYFALGVYEIKNYTMAYGEQGPMRIASLRVLIDALREAIYLFGTGVGTQIFLAIWARVRPATEAVQ